MMLFEPLWKTMQIKNVSIYALINKYNVSRGTIDNLKHNRNVTIATIERLCEILDCRVEDIVVYEKNKSDTKNVDKEVSESSDMKKDGMLSKFCR